MEGEPDPAELVTASEERELLLKAFSQLDPGDQEILELRVLGRLSAAEVGTVVGKRPGAVRMAQTRAIERLRLEAQRVGLRG